MIELTDDYEFFNNMGIGVKIEKGATLTGYLEETLNGNIFWADFAGGCIAFWLAYDPVKLLSA